MPLEDAGQYPRGCGSARSSPADEAALLDVNATAFAHHPEQGHMTLEDFRERTSEDWFDARPGCSSPCPPTPGRRAPALLGFHWTKVHRDEDPPYGEVYVVAVEPQGRRPGSRHRADPDRTFRTCARPGSWVGAALVDGDNDPAIAVYTSQGFEVERTEVQYRGVPA